MEFYVQPIADPALVSARDGDSPEREASDFIQTETGNKISHLAYVYGSENIVLGGKTLIHAKCIVRGDLRRTGGGSAVAIAAGRYCTFGARSLIRPPCKTYKGVFTYYPLKIGSYVVIGDDAVVQAAQIGSCVTIGRGAIVGRFAVLKDGCRILDDAYVAPGTVVESYSVMAGNPAVRVDTLPETADIMIRQEAMAAYAAPA
ncbi:hypothetical protein CXG81DRAFT_8949 [Caulochytrium protostelioides]|uniref:Dynactin subunit 5 n=1 Tax=Caulochytrium protostelioides TaxID=1555241 RepID=A0A4P9XFE7_9FUNG|nr:hypothetical protein CXG81DRAFT_8949 [Caulochytrium protostelioides]|eukprot:RKP03941.1 hypothetical protein CXG81DRAFT_8949 [Caulochytrium protostelioides]